MSDIVFEIDATMKAVDDARRSGDQPGEAVALTALGQALVELGRAEEAVLVNRHAAEVGRLANSRLAQANALKDRSLALEALEHAYWDEWSSAFHERRSSTQAPSGERGRQIRSRLRMGAESARLEAADILEELGAHDAAKDVRSVIASAYRPPRPADTAAGLPWPAAEEFAVGFVALKLIGPFLESFASELGKKLGESAGHALGRIRIVRQGKSDPRHLEIEVPDVRVPTTLVLPDDLSDQARLAIIELDVTADALRGRTLQWNDSAESWEVR